MVLDVMVLEVARFTVTPGSEAAFAAAFAEAVPLLADAPGCRSTRMLRGIESPSRFTLLVEWESLAAHQGFRSSQRFPAWRALIGPHFVEAPEVEHWSDL